MARVTQGSAGGGATLGWRTESRWDSPAWSGAERRRKMIASMLAVVVTRLRTTAVVLTKTRFALHNRASRFSTPTALCPPAQGCEARATLGVRVIDVSQPQRDCGMVARRA